MDKDLHRRRSAYASRPQPLSGGQRQPHELRSEAPYESRGNTRSDERRARHDWQPSQLVPDAAFGNHPVFLNLRNPNELTDYLNAQESSNTPPSAHGPSSEYEPDTTAFLTGNGQIPQHRSQSQYNIDRRPGVQAQDGHQRRTSQTFQNHGFVAKPFGSVDYPHPLHQTFQYPFSGLVPPSSPEFELSTNVATAGRAPVSFKPALQADEEHKTKPLQSRDIADSLAEYSRLIKQTNTHSIHGRLVEARTSLLALSRWLLQNLELLGEQDQNYQSASCLGFEGLTQDVDGEGDEWRATYEQRLQFWRDLHHSWLVLLQRQWDDMRPLRDARTNRSKNGAMLSKTLLEELGDEVVRVGDALEKFGLVDYEMGFQEGELIMRKTFFDRTHSHGRH